MLDCWAQMSRTFHTTRQTWCDCEPVNLLVERDHKLRALDFEGACRLDETDPPWGATPGYTPPRQSWNSGSPDAMDLYALGTSIMQLIARTESNQSGYRLQARDQETKLTSALDESHPKSAQSLA
jgi:hypothetical protein